MADRKLRSNFTPGTTPWAMRRAQWSTLGLTDEDLEKPKIAIVNSSSQLASCFSHLDEIAGPLKAAIEAAGGVAFEVRTAAPSDAITSAGAAGRAGGMRLAVGLRADRRAARPRRYARRQYRRQPLNS